MTRALLAVVAAAAAAGATRPPAEGRAPSTSPAIESRSVPVLVVAGARFRDLDRSGTLDPYEDWRLAPARRAADLVARMTLEEKAGVMMHGTAPSPRGPAATAYDLAAAETIILGARVNSLITRLAGDPRVLAEQNNALQEIAERSRLGIPLTISTDPRNHFQHTLGASVAAGGFSQWPETLGLAAARDAALVRRFADIARQEYRAVGIAMALSPQADLATEPRWPRISGTFGEDPELARELVQAYVEGFQNGAGGIGPDSVVAVVKHWVGYGAAVDGWDGHNHYGRFARLGGALDLHVRPFEGAFAARVGGVMPTYTILEDVTIDGKPIEPVGGGFNRTLLTDLLRGRHRFDGVVLSDWGITRDCGENCRTGASPHTPADIAMPWGVEALSVVERFAKGVVAGLDQFGGTDESARLVEAVRSGLLTEARLDASVHRILVQKLQLGLFERPFVDAARAAEVVGAPPFRAEAEAAQRRSLVLLENERDTLPLRAGTRVFVHGLDAAVVRASGLAPVAGLADAQLAILRVSAPFERPHPHFFFGRMHHEGRLDFRDGDPDYEQLEAAAARVPTVVTVYLDRPAILTNVRDKASAIVANFGVSDQALLDVLTGRTRAEGRLPFELPSSMAEVEAQAPGRPHDTRQPLYPIGAGAATGLVHWPQFRGAGGAGIADASVLPTRWSATENVAWTTEIPGRGWSSPIVWGDRVYLTTAVNAGAFKAASTGIYGNDYAAELKQQGLSDDEIVKRVVARDIELASESEEVSYEVLALDARTGGIVWRREAHRGKPPGGRHRKNTYASETPATDGERVYASFGGNVGVFCYSREGTLLWKQTWPPQPVYLDFGTASSPVVHGGRVYQLHDNDGDSFLAALEATTGRLVWQASRTAHEGRLKSGWATPFVWENGLRTEVVTVGRGLVISYDTEGRELWRLKGITQATPTPVAGDGLLFVGSGSQGENARPLFAIRPGATGDISSAEGAPRSEFVSFFLPRFSAYTSSPLLYRGRLYAVNDNGILQVADARSGKEIYKARVGGGGSTFSSSPLASGGRIYLLSEDGDTFVLEAGDEYKELARNSLGEMSLASPAAGADSLYLRTLTKLYRLKAPATAP